MAPEHHSEHSDGIGNARLKKRNVVPLFISLRVEKRAVAPPQIATEPDVGGGIRAPKTNQLKGSRKVGLKASQMQPNDRWEKSCIS